LSSWTTAVSGGWHELLCRRRAVIRCGGSESRDESLMPSIRRISTATVKRRDRVARWVITLGGLVVIASVLAILLLIVGVTLPLFRSPTVHELANVPLPGSMRTGDVLAGGIELPVGETCGTVHLLTRDGSISFLDLNTQTITFRAVIDPPIGAKAKTVRTVERHAGWKYTLVWDDGSLSLVEVTSTPQFDAQGRRTNKYDVRNCGESLEDGGVPPLLALMRDSEQGTTAVRLLPGGRIAVSRVTASENLLGEKETKTNIHLIDASDLDPITAMTADGDGRSVFVGNDSGRIARWELDDEGKVQAREIAAAFPDRRAVTALAMIYGDASLAVGDDRGEVTTWFTIRVDDKPTLMRIHTLAEHDGAVREIVASTRNKTLWSLGENGGLHWDHMTSQRSLLALAGESPLRLFGYSPQGNAVVALDAAGKLTAWRCEAAHPEISWRTLFGLVHYEGYDSPAFTWQTTGGDDFEPKYSLVPLLFGTLKGTFFALLLAVPLALLSAAYTAHFTTPAFKKTVKPVVELMAAIPSVVIGFLVALWLAPILERWIIAVFLAMVTIPAVFLAFMVLWQLVRRFDLAKRIETGYEFLALVPVILLGVALASMLAGPVESAVFDGSFREWLFQDVGMQFDQRNSIIIAFGLGFAVIPIIFSIAEDALSAVPYNLTAASLALGASRWQTLWRVVLPSASPGIFAGVMIGFGRAVGETMIVLMATGNTPLMDLSPFNGMRTLSANIAVEMPEAPVGGTLYRVLFLCAVILFILTFTLNTTAEVVRQRLRKRFGRL
jgi:phosphate transport system permease protein